MEETTGARPARDQGSSTTELISQLSEQVSRLVRDELRLAQLEMTRKGKRAGLGVGMLGGGGLFALYGIGCLLAAAIIALATAVAAWLAALIVGASLLVAAAAAALLGKGQLQKAAPPVPAQAVESVKADVEEIKESAHR
jgi:Putative Actinobacterial Holin-X, holin superfamily III